VRLCYIKFNYFPPYAGGGTRMAYTLFRHLAREHEVHVVTHVSRGYTEPEQILDGVHVHRTFMTGDSYSPLQGIKFFLDAWKMTRELHARHQFDVVHGYSAFSVMGLFMRWLGLKNTRICFTYEAYPISLRDLTHMRSFFHLAGLVPHLPWSGALHRTYVVSQYSLNVLKKKGIDERRVAILPPAIDLAEYQPLPNRQEWSDNFVYASSCTVWKGIGDIIEAMRLLKEEWPDFQVTMFSPEFSKKLAWTSDAGFDKLVHSYGLAENLELITELRSDVGDVMARSRAVIAPFRSMLGTVDVPLSLLEGMAVGVPVIGSAIGGIPEIVEDEVNGLLVPPQAPRRLADAMLKLLDNDDLCHQMGVYGREMVQAFSVDRVAANLLDDYTRA
jgi:glycosyltransferase involved in cell wall biosynthesis